MSVAATSVKSAPATSPGKAVRGCPSCGGKLTRSFYKVGSVPVNSCALVSTREQALAFPRGSIDLRLCPDCGFIFNADFDPSLVEYSARYEETQGFSETFNAFHEKLAKDLIARFGLEGKEVVEIGCGKGEFLTLLCELGKNRGVGVDPSYVAERSRAAKSERVRFIQDFYSERYGDIPADFFCCKMTLEHIAGVSDFISVVRHATAGRKDQIVFFQVPNMDEILERDAFWDVYYEHCSYFSPLALRELFRRAGFAVRDLWSDYDDQYLMIAAVPAEAEGAEPSSLEALERLEGEVGRFAETVGERIGRWQGLLRNWSEAGRRVVLWGSGSKAVSFITTLGLTDEIEYVVDINPHRQGMFMPASGHRIVAPEFLREYRPHTVVVMNRVYRDEIAKTLQSLGLAPDLVAL